MTMNENQERFIKELLKLINKYSISDWYVWDDCLALKSHDQCLKIRKRPSNSHIEVITQQDFKWEV